MNANQFRRELRQHGCTFENHKGGSGHVTIRRGDRKAILPVHGGRKQLGTKVVHKILRQLGIDML